MACDLIKIKDKMNILSDHMINLGSRNIGWIKEDHEDFLKIRSKYKNVMTSVEFLEDCGKTIPVY